MHWVKKKTDEAMAGRGTDWNKRRHVGGRALLSSAAYSTKKGCLDLSSGIAANILLHLSRVGVGFTWRHGIREMFYGLGRHYSHQTWSHIAVTRPIWRYNNGVIILSAHAADAYLSWLRRIRALTSLVNLAAAE